ncbi:WYL domain-containing protein [Streptomyces sp. NPDC001717]|uniref:WYL domain-containing protein n=1 Tax=Streptomyces sp. NPDC001717 TaxID=3364604 RepID=UPI0036A75AA3
MPITWLIKGHWYLIAWCRARRSGRGFRLDRIAAAAPTGEQAHPRDLAELLRGSVAAAAVQPLAPASPPARDTRFEGCPRTTHLTAIQVMRRASQAVVDELDPGPSPTTFTMWSPAGHG